MNIGDVTILQLFYAALGSVIVVYFVVATVERVIENRRADKRRR